VIILDWNFQIPDAMAVDAYKAASSHFNKHGALGTILTSSNGSDSGTYDFIVGFDNYAHFGQVDDAISSDEKFNQDMEEFFNATTWKYNNISETLIHTLGPDPDPSIKHCVAAWTFSHKDINKVISESEIYNDYWVSAGADGASLQVNRGSDIGTYSFYVRFKNMHTYGKAQDALDGKGVWDKHEDFFSGMDWKKFNLMRMIEVDWD